MSIGEDRVRVKFNPSDKSLVSQIKQKTAELIDLCWENCPQPHEDEGGEIIRDWKLAMTDFESAAMWAVKAATA